MHAVARVSTVFFVVGWVSVVNAQEEVVASEQSVEAQREVIAELREQLAAQVTESSAVLCLGRANDEGVAECDVDLATQRGEADGYAIRKGNRIIVQGPVVIGPSGAELVSVRESGLQSIEIRNVSKSNAVVQVLAVSTLHQNELDDSYLVIEVEPSGDAPSHKDIVQIVAKFDVAGRSVEVSRFARWREPVSLAGRFGFWAPVGLVGSDFDREAGVGVPFAAMPVGVAWGAQWNAGEEFHLGLSTFASWIVRGAANEDSTDDGTPGDEGGGGFTLRGLSVGLLLDVGGWVALGFAHIWDFGREEGVADPGFVAVLGFGSRLIEAISSIAD